MDFRSLGWHLSSMLILLGLLLAFPGMAQADCKLHHQHAMNYLESTRKKINGQEHPSPDTFATDFQIIIDRMESEKCLPELLQLIQHIQAEQQKYPLSKKEKNVVPVILE